MKEELQQALAAIKAKDEESARLILVRLLQEEPENVAAWILLSKLAQTDVQKVAFLRKVLAIEPEQAYARQELARLVPVQAAPAPDVPPAEEEAPTEAEEREVVTAAGVRVYDVPAQDEDIVPVVAAEPDVPQEAAAAADVAADVAPAVSEEEAAVDAIEEEMTEAALVEALEEAAAEEAVAEAIQEAIDEEASVDAGAPEAEADVAQPSVSTLPVSTKPDDYEAQSLGDTIPPWMEGEAAAQAPEARRESTPAPDDEDIETVPGWLEQAPDEEWMAEPEKTTIVAASRATSPQKEAAPRTTGGGQSLLITFLAIAALLVLVILVYQLLLLVT